MLDISRSDLQVGKRRYVLVRIILAVIKHYGQKATSRERIYLTYISWVMVYGEKQRQEPRGKDGVGSQGSTLCACLFLLASSASFFIPSMATRSELHHLPRAGSSHINQSRKCSNTGGLESSSSQMTLASVS